MPQSDLNPRQTLAVLLGASSFRRAPKFAQGRPFYNSAQDFCEYLTGSDGLKVPRENVNWLFDDSRSSGDQLQDISEFIESRSAALNAEKNPPQQLIIHYVGHGMFWGPDQAYCLAIRGTDERSEGLTSLRTSDLASVIKAHARFLRKFLILDCCFSAAAYKEFQSGPLEASRVKLLKEFPQRGTSLLCSASAHDASLVLQGRSRTMFSDALLTALRQGHPLLGPLLSVSELGDLLKARLKEANPDNWVRPEVHSPDQREGDISEIPIFPNHAYRESAAVQSGEERKKEELARIAEQERQQAIALAEEERKRVELARIAEQERQQAIALAEEERKKEELARVAELMRKQAAEQAQLEEQSKLAADQARLAEERQQAAEQARHWNLRISGTQNNLYSIFGTSDAKWLWAVGDRGTILESDDGKHWNLRASGTQNWLSSIFGTSDRNRLWAVGDKGTILESGDGGEHWNRRASDTQNALYSIFGTSDGKRLWAVGQSGTILESDDGGEHWNPHTRNTEYTSWWPYWWVFGTNDGKRLWAVGGGGTILESDDGKHWNPRPSGTQNDLRSLYGTSDGKRLWAVGEKGTILESDDDGKHWNPRPSGTQKDLRSLYGTSDGSRLWVVGDEGTILMSDDGGEHWKPRISGTQNWLGSIFGTSDGKRLWAVGQNGTILEVSIL
jgi:photosystem II stability/assembly factor-like uncharacterized protein